MTINLPYKVRAALYILSGLTAPVIIYLSALDIIGAAEVALYAGVMGFVSIVAAFNLSEDEQHGA